MSREWVVLLEATGDVASGAIEVGDVETLLKALSSCGGALHCPDRYALQFTASGSSPAEALVDVLRRWADAVRQLGLPPWEIVRTEVCTPEEFECEFQSGASDDNPVARPRPDPQSQDDDIGAQLLREAFSDPLTGLIGSEAFAHRLDVSLAGTRGKHGVGVVCLELDAFHRVNERFGGVTGDEILIEVGQRLSAVLRPGDALARLGNDEYAVLLEDTTEEAAIGVARRMVESVGRPMEIRGEEFTLSGSAGVAVNDVANGTKTVLRNAEAALRVAKAAGGGRHVLHRPEMGSPAQAPQVVRADALQDRVAHLLLMQEAAVAANEAESLHQAAQVVMRQICAHVGTVLGHLWTPALRTSGDLVPTPLRCTCDTSGYRAFQEATEKLSIHPGLGLPGRVLAAGRPVWISELAIAPDFPRQEHAVATGLRSGFAFPVLVGREVVAVLEFFSRTRMDATPTFLDVLAGIGTQLGRVVERQRAAVVVRWSEDRLRASEERLRRLCKQPLPGWRSIKWPS